MAIELHAWDTPNGRKISIALEEMGLPYSNHPVDISKNKQFDPAFLEISPNNRIPAIVDTDGPDGKRISVFESGAILIYLGEKTGKFYPAKGAEHIATLEWLMFQMGGFGPMPGQAHHYLGLDDSNPGKAYGVERYTKESARLYGVMDRRLAKVPYFAGENVTIADFSIIGWAWRHERHLINLADYPNVKRWYETMMARPGVKRGFEMDIKTPRS